MNANVCERAPEVTAEQGLKRLSTLIMKDTIPRTLLPGNLSQKQNWGMYFVCQDLKACALIRPQHRCPVNWMTAARLQQITYVCLISPPGKQTQISNRRGRTDSETGLCLQFIGWSKEDSEAKDCKLLKSIKVLSPPYFTVASQMNTREVARTQ